MKRGIYCIHWGRITTNFACISKIRIQLAGLEIEIPKMKTGSNYPLGEFYYSERISVYDRVIFISNWPGLKLLVGDL